jgi:hypothetical protein
MRKKLYIFIHFAKSKKVIFLPISIILRFIPIGIPKKCKIEAPCCIYNRIQIRILLVNWLQEELDQPDLRPRGEREEELVRRDREAPLGEGCFAPGTYRVRDFSYSIVVKKISLHSSFLINFVRYLGCNKQSIKF